MYGGPHPVLRTRNSHQYTASMIHWKEMYTWYYVEIKCQLDATGDIYCRFYCMLNMFQAIPCPSSGAREYYTDGRCLWYLVLWFSGCRYGVELEVVCPVCRLLLTAVKLLMMGIVLPKTCWACNKFCNKYHLLHLVGILFPHNNDDAQSKSLQIQVVCFWVVMYTDNKQ